ASHLALKAISCATQAALSPKHYNLLCVRSYNPWIHSPLLLSRLQRVPCVGPSSALARAVRQRRRPVNFEIRMQKLGESLIVSLLNRAKDTKEQLSVFLDPHSSRRRLFHTF